MRHGSGLPIRPRARYIPGHHPRQPRARSCPCPTRTTRILTSGNTAGVPLWDTTAAEADVPADQITGGGETLITGIAAAAEYLGYDKPDSFRRARTRHPIPGETRTGDGRPAWNPRTPLN